MAKFNLEEKLEAVTRYLNGLKAYGILLNL